MDGTDLIVHESGSASFPGPIYLAGCDSLSADNTGEWRPHIQLKWRKKPVVIEAFRYWIDPRPNWFCDKVTTNEIVTYPDYCEIKTLEGVMRAEAGDYIIRGVQGEIYPCKPDIFKDTYEPVGGSQWT